MEIIGGLEISTAVALHFLYGVVSTDNSLSVNSICNTYSKMLTLGLNIHGINCEVHSCIDQIDSCSSNLDVISLVRLSCTPDVFYKCKCTAHT